MPATKDPTFQTPKGMATVQKSCSKPSKSFKDLLAENYEKFSFSRMLAMNVEFNLDHFQFVEISVEWITRNEPGQTVISMWWKKFIENNLNHTYIDLVRNAICYLFSGIYLWFLPQETPTALKDKGEYQSACVKSWGVMFGVPSPFAFDGMCDIAESKTKKRKDAGETKPSQCIRNWKCGDCEGSFDFVVSIDEEQAYHLQLEKNSHFRVEYWFLMWTESTDQGFVQRYFSLRNNKFGDVVKMICLDKYIEVNLWCLYKCGAKHGPVEQKSVTVQKENDGDDSNRKYGLRSKRLKSGSCMNFDM